MKCNRTRKKGVAHSWLISYISVLAIPLIITGVLFLGVERLVNRKITSMNESILYQIRGNLDNLFDSVAKTCLQIEFSGELGSVAATHGELNKDYYYQLYRLKEYIRQYTTFSDYVEEVIVCLDHSGYGVTSKSTYNPSLQQEMIDRYKITGEDWEYLSQVSKRGFYILSHGDEPDRRVIYMAPLADGRILILPKEKYFNQKINDSNSGLTKVVYLSAGEKTMPLGEIPPWLVEKTSEVLPEKIIHKSHNMLYSSLDSNVADIRYIIVEQYGEIYRELQLIRGLVLASIACSMLVGIWFAVYFTRKNYTPVKELIAAVVNNTNVKKECDTNEYIFLSNAMANVINNKQEAERQLALIRLLRGQPLMEALSGKLFTADIFAVVVFALEDTSGFFGDEELVPDSHRLLTFTVSNCNKDFFEDAEQLFDVVELERYLVSIICYDRRQENGLKERIWEKIEEVHHFFNESLKIKLSIAIGDICYGPEGIGASYEKAKGALEYRMVMGNNVVIDAHEMNHFALFYDYSIESEKDIINSLKSGSFEQSEKLVFQVIDGNLASGMISAQLAKCMMFDLVGTVMKALSMTKLDNTFLGQLNPIERLSQCETFEQMKRELSDILNRVCLYINQDKEDPNKELFQNITNYIEKHYMDCELNVSMLSSELFVSKTFLVKLFKDYTGLTPLDYINRLRCERAIAMLGGLDATIEEISGRVGYSSAHSFIRVFKKLYGRTPGAYRLMLINEGLKKNNRE